MRAFFLALLLIGATAASAMDYQGVEIARTRNGAPVIVFRNQTGAPITVTARDLLHPPTTGFDGLLIERNDEAVNGNMLDPGEEGYAAYFHAYAYCPYDITIVKADRSVVTFAGLDLCSGYILTIK